MLIDVEKAQQVIDELNEKLEAAYEEIADYDNRVQELEDENYALRTRQQQLVADRTFNVPGEVA